MNVNRILAQMYNPSTGQIATDSEDVVRDLVALLLQPLFNARPLTDIGLVSYG